MEIIVQPGAYVVAVSGGVDSMALLDVLRQNPDLKLIVAHFDHGIREDSHYDRKLVQEVAARHGLPFVYDGGRLGSAASEDTARKARYAFLHRVRSASGAQAVITAHHQDDLLETAIHNMLRGTSRRGLSSLRSRQQVVRPLLHIPKHDVLAYAKDQGLVWREDSTNQDMKYRRNYIRHQLLPKFSEAQKQELLQHIRNLHSLDTDIEQEIINHLHTQPGMRELDRHWFIMLPHAVSREVMYTWLCRHAVQNITSQMLERLIVAVKTYAPNKLAIIDRQNSLEIHRKTLVFRSSGN